MTTLKHPTAALADRYRLSREIGEGRMATAYRARDIKHDRDVAIKVLHPDRGAALGAERVLSDSVWRPFPWAQGRPPNNAYSRQPRRHLFRLRLSDACVRRPAGLVSLTYRLVPFPGRSSTTFHECWWAALDDRPWLDAAEAEYDVVITRDPNLRSLSTGAGRPTR